MLVQLWQDQPLTQELLEYLNRRREALISSLLTELYTTKNYEPLVAGLDVITKLSARAKEGNFK